MGDFLQCIADSLKAGSKRRDCSRRRGEQVWLRWVAAVFSPDFHGESSGAGKIIPAKSRRLSAARAAASRQRPRRRQGRGKLDEALAKARQLF